MQSNNKIRFRPEKQYELRSTLSSDHLILLVDPRLAHLPLESLDIFKHIQIGGISRDFSIQSVYNRLNANAGLDETAPAADGIFKTAKNTCPQNSIFVMF